MPDVETLDILTINCTTIDTETAYQQINKRQTDWWSHTNKKQDADSQRQCYTNMEANTSNNTDPVVIDTNCDKISKKPTGRQLQS